LASHVGRRCRPIAGGRKARKRKRFGSGVCVSALFVRPHRREAAACDARQRRHGLC